MTRLMTTHFPVIRIFSSSAHITRFNRYYPGGLFQVIFNTPETTAGKISGVSDGPLRNPGRNEFKRNRVDTVPGIFIGESFIQENVPQVCSAIIAGDFRSEAIPVWCPAHCTGYLIIKAGPPATGIKFICRPVKLSTTSLANVYTRFIKLVIFACKGAFRSFVHNDPLFLRC